MIFENEINLFNPNAIANEFHTQSTQISVVQGKIGALISDSQIQELQSGGKNIYTRLVAAEADINGITTQVSSLRQTDGELSSQISTIRQRADSISLEVTSVKNSYAQKAQIIMAINNITQESETVIASSHISLAGKTIDLTADNIVINSSFFKVDKTGKITATSGTIGGFDITDIAIKTAGVAITSNAKNSIGLSSADFTRTIGGTSRSGLRFAIGANFGLTGNGVLYASNVNLTGTITTTDNTRKTTITSGYSRYYYGETLIGDIGASLSGAGWSDQGLSFDLKTYGDFIGWFDNGLNNPILIYDKSDWLNKDVWSETVTVCRDLHVASGFVLGETRIAEPSWKFDGVNYNGSSFATIQFILPTAIGSDGRVTNWRSGCQLIFKNGVLVGGTMPIS